MTSQAVHKTVTINILPNISQSQENQTMKFDQLIKEIFFFKIHAENEAGTLVPDLFCFYKKALDQVEASEPQFSFNIF